MARLKESEIASLNVGRGGGYILTNSTFGYLSLNNLANLGARNVALGACSLISNTTGVNNTAIGYRALRFNTSGQSNVAVGNYSLESNSTGTDNTGLGFAALLPNTTGNNNSGLGLRALRNNTTGTYNTAVGIDALRCNTSGGCNTAIGRSALCLNSIGNNNTAVGFSSLQCNTGNNNAVGFYSLQLNTTGTQNTSVGFCALRAASGFSGTKNTAIGYKSQEGSSGTTSSNTSAGFCSLRTPGSRNAAVGYRSATSTYNVADDSVSAGFCALAAPTSGDRNIAIGSLAMYCQSGTGTHCDNVAFGFNSMSLIGSSASRTSGFGVSAACSSATISAVNIDNTAFGHGAVSFTAGGNVNSCKNTGVGRCAAFRTNSCLDKTAVGYKAGVCATSQSTALGACALHCSTVGTCNTVLGSNALKDSVTSSDTTAVGNRVLCSLTTGVQNTGVGHNSLCKTTSGQRNTAAGYVAGRCVTTGSCNVFIGAFSGQTLVTTANNTISVGHDASPGNNTNRTRWGNSSNNCHCINGVWTNISDCNDKTNIKPLSQTHGLNFIKRLTPISFQFDPRESYVRECGFKWGEKDGTLVQEQKQYGFIAQEIKKILEDLNVDFDALGYDPELNQYRLGYEGFYSIIIQSLQEIDKKITDIEKEVL